MKLVRRIRQKFNKGKSQIPKGKPFAVVRKKEGGKKKKVIWGFILIFLGAIGFLAIFLLKGNYLLTRGKILTPVSEIEPDKVILARALGDLGIEIKGRILDNDDRVVIYLTGGTEVWFSKKKNLEKQAASLQIILDRFRIKGKKIEKIDFRYNKPVVK